MYKRLIILILLLSFCGVILLGCKLNKDESNENVTLTFWSGYKNKEAEVFKNKIIPKFNEKYPNVKIEATTIDESEYDKRLIESIVEGNNPDIARIDVTAVQRYAKLGAVAPIDEFKDFEKIKEEVYENTLSTNLFDGRYYGIPINTNTKVSIYNKGLLKKAGFTEAPKTFDELISIGEKLKNDGVYPLSIQRTDVWAWCPYFLSLGGKFTNEDNTKATGFLNSNESIEALQKIVDLTNGKFIAQPAFGDIDTWNGLKENKYLMIDEGTWWFGSNKDFKENVIISELPAINGKSISVMGGENTVIFNNSKNKEMASKFIQFLASDEVQTIFCEELGFLPVNKKTAQKDCVIKNNMLNTYSKQLESAWVRIPSPNWTVIDSILQKTFEKCINGSDIKLELDKAAEQLDVLLEND
ncbi:extracellular solute-binding protein [Clostridium taeniosporum]|uniref:ABC transporter substrate-binding protein n=1 Tax=Clostridium taeniosporum TaxID=394958 RepID=A0A1D7XMF1_9CLOT|nr:extracellular solute-binding protein [Clostridium taeniosporum]AOR24525.1 ABC transporter substrate-binding protein [Clostridium taeniosporum]